MNTHENHVDLLNADDVAEILNISRNKAYEILHRADCPTIYLGRLMFVKREDLLLWLDSQRRCVPRGE